MREGYVIPRQVDIEVTAACNLRCKFCPRPLDVSGHMDPELYKSIIDHFAQILIGQFFDLAHLR